MDKLQLLLAQSKPKSKITIHKEVISKQQQERIKNIQESKRLKEEEQRKKLQEIQKFYGNPKKKVKLTGQDQAAQQPPISVQQVKQKLRKLYQPVTLFGQTPHRRYLRLQKALKFSQSHPNQDMKLYTEDEEYFRRIKQNQQYDELQAKYRQSLIEPRLLGDLTLRKKKQQMVKSKDQSNKSYGQICDQILLWIRKLLKLWCESLQSNIKTQQQPTKIGITTKQQLYAQTNTELSTLLPVLRERKGDTDMIKSIYYIMNCCLIRQYVQANTRYIELSIGNAPWPMGVAMLGITVKRNAEKVSFVLENEITRKWMVGIKRLINVSQELFPSEDRMKMANYTVHRIT